MVRLDSASLEHSAKRFVGVAEGVCAITLNKNDPIVCEHAEAQTHPFLAVRKCKGAIAAETISVSLDGTNLAWSPNLHLRLRQLWLESADFRSIVSRKSVVDEGNFIYLLLIQFHSIFAFNTTFKKCLF